MTFQRMGYIGKSFTLGALGILGTLVACGGGGTTSVVAQTTTTTASPYVVMASNYTSLTDQSTDLKWRTGQGGDVFMGSGGTFEYAGFGQFNQSEVDFYQSVGIQFQHTAALTPASFIYTKIQAPENGSLNVSQSGKLVIQMGNGVLDNPAAPASPAQPNTPRIFTVEIDGGAYNASNFTYEHMCTMDVTLNPDITANRLRTYTLTLNDFGASCSSGNLNALKSDLKAVVVKVLPGKNAAFDASTSGNVVLPRVGFVGFSK